MPNQKDPGWYCLICGLSRNEDLYDPCLGKLPSVVSACCGHGGLNDAYILFENKVCIRWKGKITVTRGDPSTPVFIQEGPLNDS